ncbi:hypothetical protein D9613_005889 [Agrocybe pediades]|uniref:Uncharacterized protein n=1 Tax=Agrocybe pediades TaxID=84607 RepID=A0A8H4QTQ1_9AGAR|nr:hypothetical protein D9613_005889 [Agrocybe pediades]
MGDKDPLSPSARKRKRTSSSGSPVQSVKRPKKSKTTTNATPSASGHSNFTKSSQRLNAPTSQNAGTPSSQHANRLSSSTPTRVSERVPKPTLKKFASASQVERTSPVKKTNVFTDPVPSDSEFDTDGSLPFAVLGPKRKRKKSPFRGAEASTPKKKLVYLGAIELSSGSEGEITPRRTKVTKKLPARPATQPDVIDLCSSDGKERPTKPATPHQSTRSTEIIEIASTDDEGSMPVAKQSRSHPQTFDEIAHQPPIASTTPTPPLSSSIEESGEVFAELPEEVTLPSPKEFDSVIQQDEPPDPVELPTAAHSPPSISVTSGGGVEDEIAPSGQSELGDRTELERPFAKKQPASAAPELPLSAPPIEDPLNAVKKPHSCTTADLDLEALRAAFRAPTEGAHKLSRKNARKSGFSAPKPKLGVASPAESERPISRTSLYFSRALRASGRLPPVSPGVESLVVPPAEDASKLAVEDAMALPAKDNIASEPRDILQSSAGEHPIVPPLVSGSPSAAVPHNVQPSAQHAPASPTPRADSRGDILTQLTGVEFTTRSAAAEVIFLSAKQRMGDELDDSLNHIVPGSRPTVDDSKKDTEKMVSDHAPLDSSEGQQHQAAKPSEEVTKPSSFVGAISATLEDASSPVTGAGASGQEREKDIAADDDSMLASPTTSPLTHGNTHPQSSEQAQSSLTEHVGFEGGDNGTGSPTSWVPQDVAMASSPDHDIHGPAQNEQFIGAKTVDGMPTGSELVGTEIEVENGSDSQPSNASSMKDSAAQDGSGYLEATEGAGLEATLGNENDSAEECRQDLMDVDANTLDNEYEVATLNEETNVTNEAGQEAGAIPASDLPDIPNVMVCNTTSVNQNTQPPILQNLPSDPPSQETNTPASLDSQRLRLDSNTADSAIHHATGIPQITNPHDVANASTASVAGSGNSNAPSTEELLPSIMKPDTKVTARVKTRSSKVTTKPVPPSQPSNQRDAPFPLFWELPRPRLVRDPIAAIFDFGFTVEFPPLTAEEELLVKGLELTYPKDSKEVSKKSN